MQFTQAQHDAVYTHDRNVIVVAGAGSGKTRVLVERYLALLDSNPHWPLNALVAITFTQKAAQEMRDRVRGALQTRLNEADDATAPDWAKRLAQMDSARIDTIHALCATILRANAAEAGVDPAFEVLDETDARILLDQVIDDLLRGLADRRDPALALFAEYGATEVRTALTNFVATALDDLPADWFGLWDAAWRTDAEDGLSALLADPRFIEASSWTPLNGWPSGDKLSAIWAECRASLPLLRESDFSTRLDMVQRIARQIDLRVGGAAAWGGKAALDEAKAALRTLRILLETLLAQIGDPPGDGDRRAAALLPLWTSLVRGTQAHYRAAKAERAALDFDDLEGLTRGLLHQFPHVRARYLGAEFKHVLVDEFQDTNEAQWQIIQALADPAQPGCLFLVGDPKQSIYAFRGADVSVFSHVLREFERHGGHEVALVHSFRTHKPLVGCFNAVFERVLVRGDHSPVRDFEIELGKPMEAAREKPPADGLACLEVALFDKSLLDDDDAGKAERARLWEADWVASEIRVRVGTTLVYDRQQDAVRPARCDDFALLFQAMSNVTIYEEALKRAGVPYVTVAGRGYYDRQEVWDLLNLLHALYNPADELTLAAALRSPLFNLSDDALLALRLLTPDDGRTPLPLWDALAQAEAVPADERERVRFAHTTLTELRGMAGRLTISALLRAALERTGYLATLTFLPDGARRRGNVEKLLEKARASGKITLGAFTAYLKELSDREIREGEAALDAAGAVTLMTVHKSKGLEFPVVILVDATWERGVRGGGALLSDRAAGLACKVYDGVEQKLVETFAYRRAQRLAELREEAERRRLLYVAATRAQDYLLVSGQVTRAKKDGALKANGWLDLLLDALDLYDGDLTEGTRLDYAWGTLRLHLPPPLTADDGGAATHDTATERADETAPYNPALLADAPRQRDAPARDITATQIADLGGAVYTGQDERGFYVRRWQRGVFRAAPARIDWISGTRAGISERTIGELVHKALNWWDDKHADAKALRHQLGCYAWQQGIVEEQARDEAVERAYGLMQKVLGSDVWAWVEDARRSGRDYYPEVPFVYRNEQRIIHGVLDVLLRRADGSWAIIDYKTSRVSPDASGRRDYHAHARRYHLQVGVYAAAAAQLLADVPPDVYIHYIRYDTTVHVPQDQWSDALARLEDHIGSLIEDDDL